MGFRFRRSLKLAPGIRLNYGLRGGSFTLGPRGASVNFGSRGTFANIGMPGSGLSYREKIGSISRTPTQKSKTEYANFSVGLDLFPNGEIGIKKDGELIPLTRSIKKAILQQRSKETLEWLEKHCLQENEELLELLYVHRKTPNPYITYHFVPDVFTEYAPLEPAEKKLKLWHSVIPGMRGKVRSANDKARLDYLNEFEKWEAQKSIFENAENVKETIFNERNKNVDKMTTFLELVLSSLPWIRETTVSFELSDDGSNLKIDVDLPEIADLPDKESFVAKDKLKLIRKEKNETQRRKDYMTHVHGVGFRIIGEVFASLDSVSEIVISAFSQRLDKATAVIKDEYLYSVKVMKGKWKSINFDELHDLDPTEALGGFEIRRKMSKTGIFTGIEPF